MSTRTLFPVILGSGGPSGNYAVALNMSIDSNYVISAQLVDQHGDALGTEQTIDLPLESVVVGGSYDSSTQSLILTLDNGQSITIPVSGLISGLQATIDSNNPLNVDYTTDGTTNKVYTAAEQSKLSGIAAGAEVNVQADWSQSDNTADDYIKNKPVLGTMAAESASDYTPTSSLATVATTGSYSDLTNTPTIPAAQIQSDWNQSDNTAVDYIKNKPTIPAAQVNSDWNASSGVAEIFNKPDLTTYATKTEVDTKDAAQDAEIATKIGGVFMTQAEFESITPVENVNYFVENTTVEMVVTFTDQTTATYNVVVE